MQLELVSNYDQKKLYYVTNIDHNEEWSHLNTRENYVNIIIHFN